MVLISPPLHFEANMGQADRDYSFVSRTRDAALLFSKDKIMFASKNGEYSISFPETMPALSGMGLLPGKTNYFVGNNSSRWLTGIPNYSRLEYKGIYPGIDLVFYGNEKELEHNFTISPGADPSLISIRLPAGAKIDGKGDLLLGDGIFFRPPSSYQEIAGKRIEIPSRFVMKGKGIAGFEIARYDRTKPLVIDPALSFSTFLGGTSNDSATGVGLDSFGNIYVAGYSMSPNFPHAIPGFRGGSAFGDAFVAKFDHTGRDLLYSTFVGGAADDAARAVVVNTAGDAYITGFTKSVDFPVMNPISGQSALKGGDDAFVAKLDPLGRLQFSSFYGGSSTDEANAIKLDAMGDVLFAGYTISTDFPILNSQRTVPIGNDAFAVKLNPSNQVVYSILLGGAADDEAFGLAVDPQGNAYVTGATQSVDFPVLNQFQGYQGLTDAFLTKLDPNGRIVNSTFIGGAGDDKGYGVAVDSSGSAFVAGSTSSTNFPLFSPYEGYSGGLDAFVIRMNPQGNTAFFSTYLGGNSDDEALAIDIQPFGAVTVAGRTTSADFPLRNQIEGYRGASDAFITKIHPSGSTLVYSTYLGGTANDYGSAVKVDTIGNTTVAGTTFSMDFLTQNPYQGASGGPSDAFLAQIANSPNSPPSTPVLNSPSDKQTGLGPSVTFIWQASTDPDGDTVSYQFFICTNSSFVNCSPARITAKLDSPRKVYAWLMGFPVLALIGFRKSRRSLIMAILFVTIAFLAISCGKSKGAPPAAMITHTEQGLAPGQTYFWKVAAIDSKGAGAESQTRSFQTK